MNGALLARLRFIDCLLDHFEWVQPQHVMDYFGVASAQASRDLRAYLAHAPGNALYDASRRMYHRSATFERVWP